MLFESGELVSCDFCWGDVRIKTWYRNGVPRTMSRLKADIRAYILLGSSLTNLHLPGVYVSPKTRTRWVVSDKNHRPKLKPDSS